MLEWVVVRDSAHYKVICVMQISLVTQCVIGDIGIMVNAKDMVLARMRCTHHRAKIHSCPHVPGKLSKRRVVSVRTNFLKRATNLEEIT